MKKKIIMAIIVLTVLVFKFYYPIKGKDINIFIVKQPKTEYTSDDRISFTVRAPRYYGKIEYRVMIYNNTTKNISDLWPTHPDCYYSGWKPMGVNKLTISWPATEMEPGLYNLTVLARRVGEKVPYDCYTNTAQFNIKNLNELNTITQNEIPPSIKLADTYYESDKGKYKILFPGECTITENNTKGVNITHAKSNNDIITIGSIPLKKKTIITDKESKKFNNGMIKGFMKNSIVWVEIEKKKINLSDQVAIYTEFISKSNLEGNIVQLHIYTITILNDTMAYYGIIFTAMKSDANKSLYEKSLQSIILLKD